jgi:hypothetical protein
MVRRNIPKTKIKMKVLARYKVISRGGLPFGGWLNFDIKHIGHYLMEDGEDCLGRPKG